MMSNTFEIYQKTNISNREKNELFKAFSRGSEGKIYLLNQVLEKQDNLTLWDIYKHLQIIVNTTNDLYL